jgi:protein TonB
MARQTSQLRPHTLAHALPHAAGFALLRPAARPHLDATRILTMSGTIAINLLAMGLLMMPLAMPPPAIDVAASTHDLVARQIEKEKPIAVQIVEKIKVPTTPAKHIQQPVVAPRELEANNVVISDNGSEQVIANTIAENTGPIADMGTSVTSVPTAVQLEYRSAPPPNYPRGALQRQIEGTVILQVLVGIDGRPLEVSVSQSSGNHELDEAARNQILKRWSFRPATKNGQVVQAIGLVPVAFSLRR